MRGLSKMNFQDIWNSSTGVVRNRAGSPLWLVLVIQLGTFLCCAVSTWRWRFQIWWCLRRWTLSLCIRTQHQHMIKRSEIIQLPGSARTQERHLFWCWKQIGASKFTGPAWITHEDFRFSDGLQHAKKQWNNSVVALKCSKTSATIYSASTLPLPNSALPIVFTNRQINANAIFLFAENEVNGFCSR